MRACGEQRRGAVKCESRCAQVSALMPLLSLSVIVFTLHPLFFSCSLSLPPSCSDKGQLGLGDTRSHSLPQLVESLEGLDIKTVAAGGSHSLAFNDFFKAAQELVFLQQVRAFKEVKTSGSSVSVSDAARLAAEARAARESARQRRLGYAASPSPGTSASSSRRTSPGRAGAVPPSPSRADFGLGSPNPLVPLELKALLREVDDAAQQQQQQHDDDARARRRRRRGKDHGDDRSDSDADGEHNEQDEVDALREASRSPHEDEEEKKQARGKRAGAGSGSDTDDSAQGGSRRQHRGGAGKGGLFDDEQSFGSEGDEEAYTPERRYADETEEEFAARRVANAARRLKAKTAALAAKKAAAGNDPAAAAAAAATLAAANAATAAAAAAAAAAATAAALAAASLHIELVYSSSVSCTHRFVTFATSTSAPLVHAMLEAYVSGPHGRGRIYKQVMVTPGNTVAREVSERIDAERKEAEAAAVGAADPDRPVPPAEQFALSSTHLRHTYTYAAGGPPRYTLLLILRGSPGATAAAPAQVTGADLWPPWAADLHRLLRSTCADVAPGMDSRMSDEERAAADPAQPCFRELRPLAPSA